MNNVTNVNTRNGKRITIANEYPENQKATGGKMMEKWMEWDKKQRIEDFEARVPPVFSGELVEYMVQNGFFTCPSSTGEDGIRRGQLLAFPDGVDANPGIYRKDGDHMGAPGIPGGHRVAA